MSEIFTILIYISLIELGLCFLLGMYVYKKSEKSIRIFSIYLGFLLIIEAASKVLWYYNVNNLMLLHIYTIGEFIILILFYWHTFNKQNKIQRLMKIGAPIVLVLIILNSIFLQPLNIFNSYSKFGVGIIVISLSISYFRTHLETEKNNVLTIINSALLFYYSGSVFIFLISNMYKYFTQEDMFIVWSLNAILLIIYYLAILTGLCLKAFKKTNS